MNRKRSNGPSAHARTQIDVTTVRTKWANFAVAATPKGIASIFPIRGSAITAARASRDPSLGRRIRAGAKLKFYPASGAHPKSLSRATAALRAYASGRARRLPSLDLVGTPFQLKVWKRLCDIPSGKTISYGELAASIGRPKAARAVGAAVGANPVPILVPCHRVIGMNGSLTGFGLGLPMKKALLSYEGRREA